MLRNVVWVELNVEFKRLSLDLLGFSLVWGLGAVLNWLLNRSCWLGDELVTPKTPGRSCLVPCGGLIAVVGVNVSPVLCCMSSLRPFRLAVEAVEDDPFELPIVLVKICCFFCWGN